MANSLYDLRKPTLLGDVLPKMAAASAIDRGLEMFFILDGADEKKLAGK